MNILRWSICVLVVVGFEAGILAQTPPAKTTTPDQSPAPDTGASRSVPAAAASGGLGMDVQIADDETKDDLPRIPAVLGGRGTSLAFIPEMERSNFIRGGIGVGAAYDDNALLGSGGQQIDNKTYSVFPSIALDQSTSRTRWTLGYEGGLTVNERLSNRNQGSHALNFDSEFRLSPHVNLRAAETFSLIAGVFGSNAPSGFAAGGGGANGTLITPLANQRSSQTVVEMNYHFAVRDIVGASGSFYDLHYSDIGTGAGALVDGRTASGSAFWLHRLTARDWAGLSYGFRRLTFGSFGETNVHTVTAVNTVKFTKAFSLSGFVGPEYSDSRGILAVGSGAALPSNLTNWSVTGGVEAEWRNDRTSVTAGYARRISDGGGVSGVVRLQSVHAGLRRELFPGWAATFGVTHGNNDALTLVSAGSATSINATSVGASLERNIGRSFGLQLAYYHDLQQQTGASQASQNFDANRNRVSVTLSYQWAKPLGR